MRTLSIDQMYIFHMVSHPPPINKHTRPPCGGSGLPQNAECWCVSIQHDSFISFPKLRISKVRRDEERTAKAKVDANEDKRLINEVCRMRYYCGCRCCRSCARCRQYGVVYQQQNFAMLEVGSLRTYRHSMERFSDVVGCAGLSGVIYTQPCSFN